MAPPQELRIAADGLRLFDLPNEILIHVLDTLPTQLLLQTKSVCHRFRNLVTRIIHRRLLHAASLNDRKLILECYHPSAQYTEPYLYCDYLGTPGLNEEIQDHNPTYGGADCQAAKEETMRKLYSHFRPTRKYPAPRIFPSHPAGDIPGSRTSEVVTHFTSRAQTRIVTQNVSLEAHELFTQLHFLVAIVQTSSHRALLSVENVVDKIQRLFRDWLAARAGATEAHELKASDSVTNELDSEANEILWVDQNKIVGLKVHVKERKGRERLPVLFQDDEDQAVSYSLDLEELIVSHLHLMLAVERQLLATGREGNGQAIIFGNFARPTAQQTEEISGNTD